MAIKAKLFKRTLPPAAVPIPWNNIFHSFLTLFNTSEVSKIQFQEELQSYFDMKHCHLISSGQAAFTLILKALHRLSPERDEVVIPAFTCFSVPAAIKKAGLKITLCDLDIETLDFNQEMLKEIAHKDKNKQKLLCVVPTHLFGLPADVKSCRAIFHNDIAIVEDAAQAMGNEINGFKLGSSGDIGFFSLGRGKALSAIEGGIIITNREDINRLLAEEIGALPEYSSFEKFNLLVKSLLITLFQQPNLFWLPKSLPFLQLGETHYKPDVKLKKISNIQCCMAKNWRKRLKLQQQHRQEAIRGYVYNNLTKIKDLIFPALEDNLPLIRLPGLIRDQSIRNQVLSESEIYGFGIMPSYPKPISEIDEITRDFSYKNYPIAKKICDQVVTFPTHAYTSNTDIKNIVNYVQRLMS